MNPLEIVFEAVQGAGTPVTAEQISYGSSLPVGHVRQLLLTLTEAGYVNKVGDSYGLSFKGSSEGIAGVRHLCD